MKIQQAFQEIKKKKPSLKDLEIEFILKSLLKKNKTQLYLNFDTDLKKTEKKKLFAFIKRRQNNEPLAYILGKVIFLSEILFLSKDFKINSISKSFRLGFFFFISWNAC